MGRGSLRLFLTFSIAVALITSDIAALQIPFKALLGNNKKVASVPQAKYIDVIPVFHNVEITHIDSILQAMGKCDHNMRKFTVSLRQANAMESLKTIMYKNKENGLPLRIGASTISSVEQLLTCFESEVDFISTMHFNREITQLCIERGVPILCGVHSLEEAQEAIYLGVTSLKFYPAKDILPQSLQSIITNLNSNRHPHSDVEYFVAGGITESDIDGYKCAGADGFAVGFDCTRDSIEQITAKLMNFNEFSK